MHTEVELANPLPATSTAQPVPARSQRLPWILFFAALLAFGLAIVPRRSPPPPAPAAPHIPEITMESGDGKPEVIGIWRKQGSAEIASVILIVRPYVDEDVSCLIAADGKAVAEDHAAGGALATCVWVPN